MLKKIRATLFIVAAAATLPLGAQDGTGPGPQGRVLLLQTERGLEGEIERVGDRYRVKRGAGELWVQAEKALRLCTDWNDAYEFMKKRVNLSDPDERLRLARWCQLNNLRPQALAEAKAALEMRPAHLESRKLVTMLTQATPAAAAAPALPPNNAGNQPAKGKAAPTPVDISSDAFAVFATRVQPILMNTCVSCHNGGRGGEFQLTATDGSQRGITQANLASVLDQLRLDNLVLSPLFIKAVSRHGNGTTAPIKDRQAVPFKTMQAWVEYLLTTNPHLRFREVDTVAAPSKKAEPAAFAQTRQEPPLLAPAGTPARRPDANASPVPPPPVTAAAGVERGQAKSNDPFDPEMFNRTASSRASRREGP